MPDLTPDNRLETFLAEGSSAAIEPYTRLERILAGQDIEPYNRLEHFAKQAASGGGGGSSLPPYTYADKGKGLFLEDAEPVETVAIIVPEQSVEMTFGRRGDPSDVYYVNGADWSDVSVGDTLTLVFDGVEREATVTSDAYFSLLATVTDGAATYYFGVHEGGTQVSLSPHDSGTFTFTVSLKKVTSVTPSVQTVIVPEQTVTILSGGQPFAALTGADDNYLQSLQAGATGKLNVNGTEYDVTASSMQGQTAFIDADSTYAVMYIPGVGSVFGILAGVEADASFSVSLTASVTPVEPKWEAAIIKLNFDIGTGKVASDPGIVQYGLEKNIPAYFMTIGNSVFLGVQTIEGMTAYFGTGVKYSESYGYIVNYAITVVNGEVQTQTRQARFSLAGGE